MGARTSHEPTPGASLPLEEIERVREAILARIAPLPPAEISLEEASGRILAEGIVARDDVPPFDNTAMDGFAVRAQDTALASPEHPVRLEPRWTIKAGDDPRDVLGPHARIGSGEAARIFTGAAIPAGADAIVPFEDAASHAGDDAGDEGAHVRLDRPVNPGAHIRRLGSDIARGDRVLDVGAPLTAPRIGLLATLGHARVHVARRPRVAIHPTGDELLAITEPLVPGKIRNSNVHAVAARVRELGGIALIRPILKDTPEAVRTGIRATLSLRPDAIITIGGISAGDLDHVRDVARELGDDVHIRRLAMKPGKPLVDGLIAGVPFFGLPGNPASCQVSLEIFVRPALLRMQGCDPALPARSALLAEDLVLRPVPRVQYLRGRAMWDLARHVHVLAPFGPQGSHVQSSFAASNCLVEVPADCPGWAAGTSVRIVPFSS